MNPIIQMLMQKLQGANPQGYQLVNNLMRNGGNPEGALKQILSKSSPEQRQQILNQAKMYNCPNNILSKIQNMK